MIWDGCTSTNGRCPNNKDEKGNELRHECGGDGGHHEQHKCSWCGKRW